MAPVVVILKIFILGLICTLVASGDGGGSEDDPKHQSDESGEDCGGVTHRPWGCPGDGSSQTCVHVLHPFLKNDWKIGGDFFTDFTINRHGLRARLECRQGVISENLHNNRDLDTTYYVADSKQIIDFYWFRESGIRVNVGLENINLVPTYNDVQHQFNDNYFFSENPVRPNNSRFEEITNKYCRNPVPDYYTLTLEKAMDRATEAKRMRCTVGMKAAQACPLGVRINEMFIQRSLNEPCHMLGSYPEVLEEATNSIACTEDHDMLRQLFSIVPSEVRAVTSPPKLCRQAESNCEYCLEQEALNSDDLYANICSMIDCLITFDCKKSYSEFCKDSPIVCAMGDAYRYTLQSVFVETEPNIRYKCHLKYQEPTELYQLWFDIVIPGTHFRSPRYKISIPSQLRSTDTHYEFLDRHPTRGKYAVEFLIVEHDSGFIPYPEVVIAAHISETQWSYSLESIGKILSTHPLHKPEDFSGRLHINPPNTKRSLSGVTDGFKFRKSPLPPRNAQTTPTKPQIQPNTITPNVKSINTRFDKPFHYTTVTWNDGNCQKDLSHFQVLSPLEIENQVAGKSSVNISAIISRTTGDSKLEYHLRSIDIAPLFKFVIPANTSILRWWLKQIQSELRVQEDLFNVELRLSKDGRHWLFAMNGSFSDCPGYLSIIIHDLTDKDVLVSYDVVVPCPATFNLTLVVPINIYSYKDKTFLLLLDDTKKIHAVYLSIFINHPCTSRVGGHVSQNDLHLSSSNDCFRLSEDKNNISNNSSNVFVGLFLYVALMAFLTSAFASVLITSMIADAFSIKKSLMISKTFDHGCFVRVDRCLFRHLLHRPRDRVNINKDVKSSENRSMRTYTTVAYIVVTVFSTCAFTFNFINLIARLSVTGDFQTLMESFGNNLIKWQIDLINREDLVKERLENNTEMFKQKPVNSISACDSFTHGILKHLASQFKRTKTILQNKYPLSKQGTQARWRNSSNSKLNAYKKEVNFLLAKNKRKVSDEIEDTIKSHLTGTTLLLKSSWFLFFDHLKNLTADSSGDNELQLFNDSNFNTLRDGYKSFFSNQIKTSEIGSYQRRKNKSPIKEDLNGDRQEVLKAWTFLTDSTNTNEFICSCAVVDDETQALHEERQLAHRFASSSRTEAKHSEDEHVTSSSNLVNFLRSNLEMDVGELLLSLEWQLVKVILCFMDFALIVHRLTKLYLEMTVNYLIVSVQTRTYDSKKTFLSGRASTGDTHHLRNLEQQSTLTKNMPAKVDQTQAEAVNFHVSRKFKELAWFFENVTPPNKEAIKKNKIFRYIFLLLLRKTIFYIFTVIGLTSLLGFSLMIFFEDEFNRREHINSIHLLSAYPSQKDFIARLFRDVIKEKFSADVQILNELERVTLGFTTHTKEMKILSGLLLQLGGFNGHHKPRSCERNLCEQSGLTENKIFKGMTEWDMNLVPCVNRHAPPMDISLEIDKDVEVCRSNFPLEKCSTLLGTCWTVTVIIYGIYLFCSSLECFIRHKNKEARNTKSENNSPPEDSNLQKIDKYHMIEGGIKAKRKIDTISTVDERTNYKHQGTEHNPLSNPLSLFSETDV